MKRTIPFCSAILFLLISLSAEAQFINRIKNAAERGVSKAIEKKLESEINDLKKDIDDLNIKLNKSDSENKSKDNHQLNKNTLK